MRRRTMRLGMGIAGLLAVALPAPARGGCGCSKPPPPLAAVRPFAGAPDQAITLFDARLVPGQRYWVQFTAADGSTDWSRGRATVKRDLADGQPRTQLRVRVGAVSLGPCALTVWTDTAPLYGRPADRAARRRPDRGGPRLPRRHRPGRHALHRPRRKRRHRRHHVHRARRGPSPRLPGGERRHLQHPGLPHAAPRSAHARALPDHPGGYRAQQHARVLAARVPHLQGGPPSARCVEHRRRSRLARRRDVSRRPRSPAGRHPRRAAERQCAAPRGDAAVYAGRVVGSERASVTPRTALARALAVAGGAGLYALALPPADVAALAWLTLVPLLLAVRDSRPRAAFGLGALYGFVAAATVTWWLVPALAAYFGRSLLFAALAMSAVYALAVSATCGTFAAGASVLLRQGPWPVGAATVPALWVTIELVRGRVLGEPWALLGYTQHAAVGLIQTAALAGVYGLSYLVALGNVALAEATARLVARGGLRPAAAALAGPAAVIAAVWLGGAAVVPAPSRARATVPVAVVQANVPPAFEWTRAYAEHQLLAELEATARVPAASHPALIVWPENAI